MHLECPLAPTCASNLAMTNRNPAQRVRCRHVIYRYEEPNHCGVQRPANQPDAASFMILTIVPSTSCATRSSCGALNIARRVVGFNVAMMALPPSS